ncbi:multimodular transpeptidase-transglycosylase [Rhodococcus aetherivorans]|uniref:Multimodular transpeptidase-transglycosylase n=2 Tax=Rhodococcus TaxID=1827 RepID=A0ABQ0YEC1_9NOCA|nr:transglycosylase domain-containing protein [Rhodococcus aetherivorans]ETT25100.1 Peptidoglycan glycosyltransferase [Rhodococcus rhodochrous ATCC 21198]GES34875.1 multimodular transpeptidase-transglycosylase [Rhodococcus aetherivorans]
MRSRGCDHSSDPDLSEKVVRVSSTTPSNPQHRKPTAAAKARRWRIVGNIALAVVAVLVLVPALAFAVAYMSTDVPRPSDMRTNQVATVYAADGTTELSRIVPPEGNRVEVDLAEIPEHVRNAVLSAEDRNFYSNPGFSVSGFARAARDNVLGKETAGGGSTITQQYVKNVLVGADRTVTRKMRELVISTKMARQWSKDEILQAYLNTIYFGRGAYGIAAAAQAYFGKPVGELSVAEGAVLAGVIQTPSALDPEFNRPAIEARWNYVLDGMVEMGELDTAEREAQEFPPTVPAAQATQANEAGGPEGLLRTQVIRELEAAGISGQVLSTEGLQITTTIDPRAQQAAIDSARETLEGEPANLRTAVVSIDPRTGAVRAYYGGEEGAGFDFAQAPVQTGSAFKVFGLVAALKDGIGLNARFSSAPLTVGNLEIGNVEGESCGVCTIAEALKRSLNTSFYRLMLAMEDGPQKIADAAHEAGIPLEIPGIEGPTLSHNGGAPEGGIVLGQYQSRVIDMASAYATLAASGTYHQPYFVQRVVNAEGEVLLDRPASPGEQRLDPAVADNVTQAMQPIAAYSRGHALAGGRPSAAKTGTTQLGDTGLNKDAWMVGYTPSLSTAVWVGTPDGTAITNSWGGSIYGSMLPSDIWKGTMDGALEGTEVESFPWPEPIGGQAGVPADTGVTAPSNNAPAPVQLPQLQLPELPPITIPAPPVELPPEIQVPQQIEVLPGVTIQIPG